MSDKLNQWSNKPYLGWWPSVHGGELPSTIVPCWPSTAQLPSEATSPIPLPPFLPVFHCPAHMFITLNEKTTLTLQNWFSIRNSYCSPTIPTTTKCTGFHQLSVDMLIIYVYSVDIFKPVTFSIFFKTHRPVYYLLLYFYLFPFLLIALFQLVSRFLSLPFFLSSPCSLLVSVFPSLFSVSNIPFVTTNNLSSILVFLFYLRPLRHIFIISFHSLFFFWPPSLSFFCLPLFSVSCYFFFPNISLHKFNSLWPVVKEYIRLRSPGSGRGDLKQGHCQNLTWQYSWIFVFATLTAGADPGR